MITRALPIAKYSAAWGTMTLKRNNTMKPTRSYVITYTIGGHSPMVKRFTTKSQANRFMDGLARESIAVGFDYSVTLSVICH